MTDTIMMLTTIDNPYNPHTEFDSWYLLDEQLGYHTCGYLARLVVSSDALSDEVESLLINEAIDEIVNFNIIGKYIKVSNENFQTELEAGRKRLGAT